LGHSTRPWFAAFFKRRPSMDPYKAEVLPATPALTLLNRLRAKSSQAQSPKRAPQSPKRVLQMEPEHTGSNIDSGASGDDRRQALLVKKLERLQAASPNRSSPTSSFSDSNGEERRPPIFLKKLERIQVASSRSSPPHASGPTTIAPLSPFSTFRKSVLPSLQETEGERERSV